jgi:hypothetical protein
MMNKYFVKQPEAKAYNDKAKTHCRTRAEFACYGKWVNITIFYN